MEIVDWIVSDIQCKLCQILKGGGEQIKTSKNLQKEGDELCQYLR